MQTPLSALTSPATDPTPIFEFFRGSYGTELLTAAASHFRVFDRLADRAKTFDELRGELSLERRAANVLGTALRAFGLIVRDEQGALSLTPLAREHLLSAAPFDVSDYLGLAADSPGVKEMIARLRTNRPAGAEENEPGAAFIFRDGLESAMEREASARHFTLALAGRAKNVAPSLAQRLDLSRTRRLLDIGGGTGIYSIALLQKFPHLTAVVWDRPEVLKVASEMGAAYGVADRLTLEVGDMFRDPFPSGCDAMLLSNILHDWDEPECETLVRRCGESLAADGRLFIHDVFLNDDLGGPLPIALYSAALFCFTEGRAYSVAEYRQWLTRAGFDVRPMQPTLIHCGVIEAVPRR